MCNIDVKSIWFSFHLQQSEGPSWSWSYGTGTFVVRLTTTYAISTYHH